MIRDRFTEFYEKANIKHEEEEEEIQQKASTADVLPVPNTKDGLLVDIEEEEITKLNNFHGQVSILQKLVNEISQDVFKIKTLHNKISKMPRTDENTKAELETLMSTIKISSSIVRSNLKDMEKDILLLEKEEGGLTAIVRMRKTQYSAVLRNFVDVMNAYQLEQSDYMDRCKDRIKRQSAIIGTAITEEDIDEMLEKGNLSMFTRGILLETEQAKQTLADVQDRHNDILKLERSLKELHDLFFEMAVLIESQGEVLDRIAPHVNEATNYIVKTKEQLIQAKEIQASVRKKYIWIIIALLVVGIVLGLSLFFFLR